MDLVFIINRNYIDPLSVTVYSIVKASPEQHFNLYIIHDDLTEADCQLISDRFEKYKLSFQFVYFQIENDQLNQVDTNHLPLNVMYRLLLAQILPINVEKVLFLDADLLITEDISPLFNTDIGDHYVGAVVDILDNTYQALGLNSIYDYFNAGVLLVNLKKWREDHLSERFIEYAIENMERLRYADQDILNAVCHKKWYKLDQKWNVISNIFENPNFFDKHFSREIRENLISKPGVIHFTGDIKPWSLFSNHLYTEHYIELQDELGIKLYGDKKINIDYKIALFGTSLGATIVVEKLKQAGLQPAYYFDNDQSKWGNFISNAMIKNPADATHLCATERLKVIIASSYVNEIGDQLFQLGLVKNKDYFNNLGAFEQFIRAGD